MRAGGGLPTLGKQPHDRCTAVQHRGRMKAGTGLIGATHRRCRSAICLRMAMPDTKKDPRPVPAPRPKDAPKRPRVKQRPEPIPTTDAPEPEAPQPDRGVAPGITG